MSRTLVLAALCFAAVACSTRAQSHPTTTPTVIPAATPVADIAQQEPALEVPSVDRDALRERLALRRSQNLSRLLAYANAGVFPINRVTDGALNIFVDEGGHICAAANLIRLDGHGELVAQTATEDNYIVLSTVESGPLYDWMLTSGFTQDEVALIQRPYMGQRDKIDFPLEPSPIDQVLAAAEAEKLRMQNLLRDIHGQLEANTDVSLARMIETLDAHPALALALISQPSSVTTASL